MDRRTILAAMLAAAPLQAASPPPATADPADALAALDDSGFEPHPYLVYAPRERASIDVGAGEKASVNAQGYRGPLLPATKAAAARRVVCLGGSEIFGLRLGDARAFPARLAAALAAAEPTVAWEVANAAAPGYTSHEIAGSFALRWLDLQPDAIVIGDLDADARAMLTPGFRDDYGHVWRVWVDDRARQPRPLRERVLAAPVAPPLERARALEAATTRPFETNLKFVLDVARGRGIRAVILVPDPRRFEDAAARTAVERLRDAARSVAASRGAATVDESDAGAPHGAAPSPPVEALAGAAAGAIARLPW